MLDYLRHLRHKVTRNPAPGLILDAWSKLGLRVLPFYLFVEPVQDRAPPSPRLPSEEVSIELLDEGDMAEIAALPNRGPSLREHLDNLRRGQRCLGLRHRGRITSFSWYDLDVCSYRGLSFPLLADEAYLFDQYTLMDYRGCGLAPYLRYQLHLHLRELGRRRLFSISNRYNAAALRFKAKLGAEVVASFVSAELLWRWQVPARISAERLAQIRQQHQRAG